MTDFNTNVLSSRNIQDKDLQKFVTQVTDICRAATYQAMWNRVNNKPLNYKKWAIGVKTTVDCASVGEVMNAWLATKSPEVIKAALAVCGPRNYMRSNPTSIMRYMDLNNTTNYVAGTVNHKDTFKYITDDIILNRFARVLGISTTPPTSTGTGTGATGTGTSATTPASTHNYTVKLNLKSVRCMDETWTGQSGARTAEWTTNDSVSSTGIAVDNRRTDTAIPEFVVGKFTDSDVVTYTPVKVLHTFTLDNTFPAMYMAMLALSEKDNGQLGDFLPRLFEAVKAEVMAIFTSIAPIAGPETVNAIKGSTGTVVPGPVGTTIGMISGLVLSELIGWVVTCLQDDIYPVQMTAININQAPATPFNGPVQTLNYQDFDGSYIKEVFWSVGQ